MILRGGTDAELSTQYVVAVVPIFAFKLGVR